MDSVINEVKFLTKLAARKTMGRMVYEECQFFRRHRYWPNFHAPKTLSEKICARKFDPRVMEWIRYVDKVAVRDYVANTIGADYLTKTYDVVESGDQIDFGRYPERFVLKGNHGSGKRYIRFVNKTSDTEEAKVKHDIDEILRMGQSLRNNFGYFTNELWYSQIPPKVSVEDFLDDGRHTVPPDYKFFVFHGRVELIQLDIGRYQNHQRSLYDRDWVYQDLKIGYPKGDPEPRPGKLGEMVDLAERLSMGLRGERIDFIRVDLFSVNDRIRFGELTLTPGMGWECISPRTADYSLGALW